MSGAVVPRGPTGLVVAEDPLRALALSRCAGGAGNRCSVDFQQLIVAGSGTEIVKSVAQMLVAKSTKRSGRESLLQRFARSDTDWSTPGRKLVADLLGKKTHSHVKDDFRAVAAAEHFGVRSLFESILAGIIAAVDSEKLLVHDVWKFFGSDTTTLPIGKLTWSARPRVVDTVRGPSLYICDEEADDHDEETPTAKIHQSDLTVALMLEHRRLSKRILLVIPLVMPLAVRQSRVRVYGLG